MYNVSEEYLEKINSSSKVVYWYGKITLKSGVEILFDTANLKKGQTSITFQLCDASSIKIGCACSAELKISFLLDYDQENNLYYFNGIEVNKYDFYDAKIELTYRLYLDPINEEERYEEISFPTFTATEVERSIVSLNCVAYDYMTKFMKSCISTIQGSPYNALTSACAICGVEFGQTPKEIRNMPNGSRVIAEYDPQNQITTWRDVISYVAGMLCGNAIIKSDNKLYIIPYDKGEYRSVDAGQRASLTIADYISNYQEVSGIDLRTNTEEKVKDGNGMTYKMGGNPLMQYVTANDRKAALTSILDILSEMPYVPFSGSFFCDPSYELGDRVDFSENHAGDSTYSIVTKIELHINGYMQMSCEGDDPYKQAAEEAADKEYSRDTSGSVGDGVTFYDFVSSEDVTIADGSEEEICSISYSSNGDYRQEFAAQVKIGVATTETFANDIYTENDCDVLVTYYLNGQEIAAYHPEQSFTDGIFLLDLFYVWSTDVRIDTSTFEVSITATGGAVSVLSGNCRARIMQGGTAYVAPSNELEYIQIDAEPKLLYHVGETIDYTGLLVNAYYEDGHAVDVTSQCTITPAAGTVVTEADYVGIFVKIEYQGFPESLDLEVDALIAISVKKDPTKDSYFVGENIDLSGLKIEASYSVSKDKDVTSKCTFNPADGTQITAAMVSDHKVNVIASHTDHTITKTCTVPLIVEEVMIENLEITSPPTKTAYKVGEALDLTGIVVTASYSDGTSADVTSQCTFSPANGASITAQTTAVTATYQSLSDTCDLTIITFDGIEITQNPSKTKYFEGQTLTLAGLIVSGVWSDGSKEDVTSSCTFIPQEGSTVSLNTSSVEVRYTKAGTTYREYIDITVVENEISLKYFNYTVDETNKIITITSNKLDEMAADGVTDLYIPDRVVGSNGYTYRIRID